MKTVELPEGALPLSVVGENTESVGAAVDGNSLFITVPGSTGCDWLPRVLEVNEAERRVEVELSAVGSDPCAADLIYRTHELSIEPDVHDDYAVHVRYDERNQSG